MASTPAQLATAVMRRLNAVDVNKAPSAAHSQIIIDRYGQKFAEWTAKGFTDAAWTVDSIPDAIFPIAVALMANEIRDTILGMVTPEPDRLAVEQGLLNDLRMLLDGVADAVAALRTKTQLSTAVLRKLKIISPLATPSTKDAAIVWAAYDDKLSEWSDRGLVYWDNTNATTAEIPKAVFAILVNLLCNELALWFGASDQSPADKAAIEEGLLAELRRHVPGTAPVSYAVGASKIDLSKSVLRFLQVETQHPSGDNVDAEVVWSAYDSRYAEWAREDITYWPNSASTSSADIPRPLFRSIVRIIAEDVAPEFGRQVAPEMDEDGRMVSPGIKGMRAFRRHISRDTMGLPVLAEYY